MEAFELVFEPTVLWLSWLKTIFIFGFVVEDFQSLNEQNVFSGCEGFGYVATYFIPATSLPESLLPIFELGFQARKQ